MPRPRKVRPPGRYKTELDIAQSKPIDGARDLAEMHRLQQALGLTGRESDLVVRIWQVTQRLRLEFKAAMKNARKAPSSDEQHEAVSRLGADARRLAATIKSLDGFVADAVRVGLGDLPTRTLEFAPPQTVFAEDCYWRGAARLMRLRADLKMLDDSLTAARAKLHPKVKNAQGRAAAPFRSCALELGSIYRKELRRCPDLKRTPGGFVALLRAAASIWGAQQSDGQLIAAARWVRSELATWPLPDETSRAL